MTDQIETRGRSLIQHGDHSERIYLMKLSDADMPEILAELEDLAVARGYTKIFAKIPARHLPAFSAWGFVDEARVPGFFGGREDGVFVSRYFDDERRTLHDGNELLFNLQLAERKWGRGVGETPPALRPQPAGPDDIEEMSRIYAEVFPTYPFPIQDPDYLRRTMAADVAYYCVREEGRIVALASAEMDPDGGNVEMTDFATRPDALGQGFAQHLLARMEQDMRRRGFPTAYTIARSRSAGMNITFAKLRYVFAGMLVNNTNISGRIESMNVWYKPLDGTERGPGTA